MASDNDNINDNTVKSDLFSSGWSPSLPQVLTGLALFAFLFRFQLVLTTYVYGTDGTTYLLDMNRIMDNGLLTAIREGVSEPVYPVLLSVLHTLSVDPVSGGYAISLVFGSLSVVILFLIVRELFSFDAALVAALVLIFHPQFVDAHADLKLEATFHFFLLASMYLMYRFLAAERWGYLAGAFLMTVFCVGTRQEGALLMPLHAGVLVWVFCRRQRSRARWLRYGTGVGFFFVFPAAAGLIVLLVSDVGFVEVLNRTKAGVLFNLFSDQSQASLEHVSEFIEQGSRITWYHLNLFLLIGMFVVNGFRREDRRYPLFSYGFVFLAMLFISMLGIRPRYINERYLMTPFLFFLPVIASGFLWSVQYVRTRVESITTNQVALLGLLFLLVPLMPTSFELRRVEQYGVKRAGLHIRSIKASPNPVISCSYGKLQYFAKTNRFREMPSIRSQLKNRPGELSLDYLVLTQEDFTEHPSLRHLEEREGIRRIGVFPEGPGDWSNPAYLYVFEK